MTAMATGVPAQEVVDALDRLEVTHVVVVPDTNQQTVLTALDAHGRWSIVRVATEADALGVCLGLWIGGRRPVASIQQLGLFAAANTIRAIAHDSGAPLAILAGLYGRELDRDVSASSGSAVRLCVPLLDALEVSWSLVENPAEAHRIEEHLGAAFEDCKASVVLLGAPTL